MEKLTRNTLYCILSLGLLLLTACGSDGKKSSNTVTTTLPICVGTAVYVPERAKWYQNSDLRVECQLSSTPTVNNAGNCGCATGLVPVRMPISYFNNGSQQQINCANNTVHNNTVYNNPHGTPGYNPHAQYGVHVQAGFNVNIGGGYNYHTNPNQYGYTCVNSSDRFLRQGSGYYYYDYHSLYSNYGHYSHSYHLSPKDALYLGLGAVALGVLFNVVN